MGAKRRALPFDDRIAAESTIEIALHGLLHPHRDLPSERLPDIHVLTRHPQRHGCHLLFLHRTASLEPAPAQSVKEPAAASQRAGDGAGYAIYVQSQIDN